MDGSLHLMAYIDIFSGTTVFQLMSIRHGRSHVVDCYEGNLLTEIPITGRNFIDAYKAVINGIASAGSGVVSGSVSGAMGASANIVSSALDVKPTYEKTGAITGSATRISPHIPYVFFDTPQLRQPNRFREEHGYVSNLTKTLGESRGYNEVKYIDLSSLEALDTEKAELLNLLQTGVYVS